MQRLIACVVLGFLGTGSISAQIQKTEYLIGAPSAEATLYLELINRARADALQEASRLATTTDREITQALRFWGISPSDIETHFRWDIDQNCIAAQAQPLAFNSSLLQMATLHAQDQHDNGFQGHVSSDNPPAPFQPGDTLGDRVRRVGYSFLSLGENTFTAANTVDYGHAAFEIDWGAVNVPSAACYNPSFATQNMQNPGGHRLNLHNDIYREIGVGVVANGDGSHVVTQNLGTPFSGRFATGVVFDDQNENGFYDLGEGVSGVRIDSDASDFYAISTQSGAYSLPLTELTNLQLIFAPSNGLPFAASVNADNDRNIKVDYRLQDAVVLAGDFNADGVLDVADLDQLTLAVRGGSNDTLFDLNSDLQITSQDRVVWVHDLTRTYFGDANLDRRFDTADMVAIFQPGQYEDGIADNSTWSSGDFNGDGEFDTQDIILAFQDGGYEQGLRAATLSVPEPATRMLILWGIGCGLATVSGRKNRG